MKITHKGNFNNTYKFLNRNKHLRILPILHKYGSMGVVALRNATPKDSGLTAESWGYEIETNKAGMAIQWYNNNVVNRTNIAVILQFGHATRNGGFVQGIDYINPALKPIFENISKELWREVVKQ